MGKRQAILCKGFTFSIVSQEFYCQEHSIEKVCSFQVSYTMLAPGKKHRYRKTGGYVLYGCSGMHRYFRIYFFNPCFQVQYFLPGTGVSRTMVSERSIAMCMVLEKLPVGRTMAWLSINRYDARAENLQWLCGTECIDITSRIIRLFAWKSQAGWGCSLLGCETRVVFGCLHSLLNKLDQPRVLMG